MWREGVEERTDALPCCFDGSFGSFSQEQLELGKDLFDRVQVGRVWRQEQEFCAGSADCFADGLAFMAPQIVHDDDVSGRERRHEELLDIGGKAHAVDRTVQHTWGVDPVVAQRGKEGERAPFAERGMGNELLPARSPAPDRRHVRLRPGFVNEDQPLWIKPPLIFLPLSASSRHRWPGLLLGEQAFF